MVGSVGILAYGSLVHEPGEEIRAAQVGAVTEGVVTPSRVEFARSSATRAGAPTLVPVDQGGAVPARILLLQDRIDEATARAMLWRRESRKVGNPPYDTSRNDLGRDLVRIVRLEDFRGVPIVLYTCLGANIHPLTPNGLLISLLPACNLLT